MPGSGRRPPHQKRILHLSRFSTGLPLLIPTDRAAPSYQLLVLSLASLAFVLFVAITDVLTFGAHTEVRSFLDINIRPPLRQANASVLRRGERDPESPGGSGILA